MRILYSILLIAVLISNDSNRFAKQYTDVCFTIDQNTKVQFVYDYYAQSKVRIMSSHIWKNHKRKGWYASSVLHYKEYDNYHISIVHYIDAGYKYSESLCNFSQ